MTGSATVMQLRGVVAGYGQQEPILQGIDLDIAAGHLTVLIGPNGAGKSTLLKTIAGVIHPSAGSIRLAAGSIGGVGGVEDAAPGELQGLAPRAVARLGVAFVPQESNVFDSMSVMENLEVAAWVERRHWRARAAVMLARFPVLAQNARRPPRQLSGGQRQTLAMAMGLMGNPRVLLLDEPSAGLSPAAAQLLFESIRTLRDEGMSIVMVEQHAVEALRIADDACVLVNGRVARAGPAGALADDPDIQRLFLGG